MIYADDGSDPPMLGSWDSNTGVLYYDGKKYDGSDEDEAESDVGVSGALAAFCVSDIWFYVVCNSSGGVPEEAR